MAGASGVGFRRIHQRGGLAEILRGGEYQQIDFLLAQRRRQLHHPFQAVGAHHARLLIGKKAAREPGGGTQVLVEHQHIGGEYLIVRHFAAQRHRQLALAGRQAKRGDRTGDAADVKLRAALRQRDALRARGVDGLPAQSLQARGRDRRRGGEILRHQVNFSMRWQGEARQQRDAQTECGKRFLFHFYILNRLSDSR